MPTVVDLKKALGEELAKDKYNPAIVSQLSDALLDLSSDSVRFTVDAQHINRLGYELVGKQETALSELIKNAYDADATKVSITFQNYDRPGGTLIIRDDGTGMTADTIRNTWMRLSTNDKTEHPVSPIFARPRAGKKGIGRFAVQRLGERLTLETGQEGVGQGIRVKFNWDEQFKAGVSLGHIWNSITTVDKAPEKQGTTLIVEGLRDGWTREYFDRAWRSVLFLQPPFPLKLDPSLRKKKKSDIFEVSINGITNGKKSAEIDLSNSFLNQSVAEINSKIDENGVGTVKVVSKKLGIDEEVQLSQHFIHTGPLEMECRYFIYSRDLLAGVSQRDATQMGRLYGGVRIYRNNFRVAPYGEPSDDWLRLADQSARRVILSAFNNNNFFGHIALTSEKNQKLDETSSREGLVENDAFTELREFAFESLELAVQMVAQRRNRKNKPSQTDYVPTRKASNAEALEKLEEAQAKLNDAVSSVSEEQTQINLATVAEIIQDVKSIQSTLVSDDQAYLEYENMLRILASLGVSISIFGHEIKAMANTVRGQLTQLRREAASIKAPHEQQTISSRAELLSKATERVFNLGGYIEKVTSYTESRALRRVHVLETIESFSKQFHTYLLKQNIKVHISVSPRDLSTLEMHASELEAVLFNFTTNAVKAIRKQNPVKPSIKISASEDGRYVLIRFEDNGTGVDDSIKGQIFDAFFTTTRGKGDDFSGMGTGLGLRIVADIASSYGGSVELADPEEGYSTCFEFRILKS